MKFADWKRELDEIDATIGASERRLSEELRAAFQRRNVLQPEGERTYTVRGKLLIHANCWSGRISVGFAMGPGEDYGAYQLRDYIWKAVVVCWFEAWVAGGPPPPPSGYMEALAGVTHPAEEAVRALARGEYGREDASGVWRPPGCECPNPGNFGHRSNCPCMRNRLP